MTTYNGGGSAGLRQWLTQFNATHSGIMPNKKDVTWDPVKKTWTLTPSFQQTRAPAPGSTQNPYKVGTDGKPIIPGQQTIPDGYTPIAGNGGSGGVTTVTGYQGADGSIVKPDANGQYTFPDPNATTTPTTTTPSTTTPSTTTPTTTTPTTGPSDGSLDDFAGFDPAVAHAIFDTYNTTKDYLGQGLDSQKNADANSLRDRVGQVANQQRSAITSDFLGRGVGSSPILQQDQALGGTNTAEQNAVSQGLLGLDSQYADRYVQGLGALNTATGNALTLGNDSATYSLGTKKLLQDSTQFDKNLDFEKSDADAKNKLAVKLQKLSNSGKVPADMIEFLKTIMSGLG